MTSSIISTIVAAIVLIWIYGTYVALIQKRNKALEAFSAIDVQLKKRYDLIPNILKIAKRYMEHERDLIENVTKLRSQIMELPNNFENIDRKIALDKHLSKGMDKLLLSVENYPEIKADQAMIVAMQSYNEVEEHISAARRFYNSAAMELKNAVEIFPSSLIARMINVKSADFFSAEEKARQPVNASDYLN